MSTMDPTDRESYGDYSVDDENQPAAEDLLLDDEVDEAERGYSPPEKYSPAQGFGNTPLEEAMGETLEQRVAQEEPEPDPYVQAEQEAADLDSDGEVGDQRAGRLVDTDRGVNEDVEKDLVAEDVGIDGAAASAEEAAVHVVDEDQLG
ncbi:MAG TPA: DUF5709 domain-containing protein [Nocardioides sp.]|nr:DUF5709 domain-containing protein [Nocardioides sp.]